ncbi:hypothetical protein QBC32DRAFT_349754 [Pseudoneurospora amorphoporcata]|uniref:Secreted protein n=1 Tax=Pseudoneurospora amorphoporcata TaxID=241081 RepID=A0AAN6NP08_9PEZI|nr:hypothetical protein QBC32DRAFT_349754 [Pseudoneurospora amorphoporcata]
MIISVLLQVVLFSLGIVSTFRVCGKRCEGSVPLWLREGTPQRGRERNLSPNQSSFLHALLLASRTRRRVCPLRLLQNTAIPSMWVGFRHDLHPVGKSEYH